MSAAYVPQVGDTVRHDAWSEGDTARVTAVGERKVLMVRGLLPEASWDLCHQWHKVVKPKPLPERWVNLTTRGLGNDYSSKADADEVAASHRLAILHIWTDADGVDHADIERVAR